MLSQKQIKRMRRQKSAQALKKLLQAINLNRRYERIEAERG